MILTGSWWLRRCVFRVMEKLWFLLLAKIPTLTNSKNKPTCLQNHTLSNTNQKSLFWKLAKHKNDYLKSKYNQAQSNKIKTHNPETYPHKCPVLIKIQLLHMPQNQKFQNTTPFCLQEWKEKDQNLLQRPLRRKKVQSQKQWNLLFLGKRAKMTKWSLSNRIWAHLSNNQLPPIPRTMVEID